jgi:hypothetical protein
MAEAAAAVNTEDSGDAKAAAAEAGGDVEA